MLEQRLFGLHTMAKIHPANVAPDAYPRMRGVLLTRTTTNGIVVQKWPDKRGPSKTRQQIFLTKQFGMAGTMAANSEPMAWETAEFLSRGTVWMPRDILVMAIYGKLYELTGPNGEQYHQADHGLPPSTPNTAWQIAASANLPIDNPGFGGYTLRNIVPSTAILFPDGLGARFRLQGSFGNGPTDIGAAFVGKGATSGNDYAFASTPEQLTFGGAPGVILPNLASVVSDPTAWAPATGDTVVLSVYFASSSAPARSITFGVWTAAYKFGNDASTVAATGYTSYPHPVLLNQIETLQLV